MFDVFSAAFAFRGRIGRGSYWGLTILCMLALFGSSVSVALTANYTNATPVNVIAVVVAIVGAVFFLVMCIVLFGTVVCRLRDRGKSGFGQSCTIWPLSHWRCWRLTPTGNANLWTGLLSRFWAGRLSTLEPLKVRPLSRSQRNDQTYRRASVRNG